MAESGDKRTYKSYLWVHPKSKKKYSRVQIKQADGTYKTYLKPALNKKHADQLAREMFDDYAVRKTGFIEGESMTFDELAEWYKKTYVVPPVYSPDGLQKVKGMRTHQAVKNKIENMKKFFGNLLIKNIDEDTLYQYKRKREKQDVTPATINRDLEILKAMFRKAVRRRWLKFSPFDYGDNLIEKGLERSRDATLTPIEEEAILEVTKHAEKTLLYYAILCLLYTGARPSEIYDASTEKAAPVKWRDFFDYDFKAVKLTSYKGKKVIIRYAPVPNNLKNEMLRFWHSLKSDEKVLENQIFPVSSFKTAWGTARRDADMAIRLSKKLKLPISSLFDESMQKDVIINAKKDIKQEIENLKAENKYKPAPILSFRIRDLRRNWSSWIAKLGVEGHIRQKLLGHEQLQTTFDYTQADLSAVEFVRSLMNDDMGIDEIQRFDIEA